MNCPICALGVVLPRYFKAKPPVYRCTICKSIYTPKKRRTYVPIWRST